MADGALDGPGIPFGRIAGAVPVSGISRAPGFILRRDAAELHLTLVKGHQGGSHNVAHLLVADAAALHDHLAARGVRIVKACATPTTGCAASSSPARTATASTSGSR